MASGVANSLSSSEFGDGSADDIIEIVSVDEYDSQRAKLRSSISWLTSKAYGKQVPRDLKDPFYENSEGQLMLRPVLVNLLSSSELYCTVCGKIFPDTHTQWRGHWSIIQVLSRKGIYISDVQDTSVTETVLVQTAPFRLKAHLALMDALMRAYLAEVASVEKVVKAVRRITTFNASTELPSNPEEALEFWINKVGQTLAASGPVNSTEEGHLIEGETNQKVRIVAKTSPTPREQQTPRAVSVPPLEDLMRDIGDGCAIAAVISYYRPNQLNVSDICLKSQIGIADSLYNLRQVSNFCKTHLPWSVFHLSYEDFLYTHATLKVNLYTFVADLFCIFEAPVKAVVGNMDAIPAAGRKSGQALSSVPNVSNATKKSFQKLPLEDTASNLGLTPQRSPAGSTPGHQPLLARRAAAMASNMGSGIFGGGEPQPPHPPSSYPSRRGRRVQSLSTPQERDQIHRSVIAWQDDQKLSARSSTEEGGPLLANVSIDSTLDQSLDIEFEPGLSLELTGLDTPRVPNQSVLEDRSHPDYMEVESVQSGHPSTRRTANNTPSASSPFNTTNNTPHRKQQQQQPQRQQSQSDERDGMEPLMPAVLRPTKEKALSKAEERGDRGITRKRGVSSPQSPSTGSARDGSTTSSWSDETCVTPLAEASHGLQSPSKRNEAFVIGSSDFDSPRYGGGHFSSQSPLPSARSDTCSVAESYIIPDRPQTATEAVRAGIPVVSDMEENSPSHGVGGGSGSLPSREGSVASSGEYSDHESLKIHQDHKNRESGSMSQSSSIQDNLTSDKTLRGEEKQQEGKLALIITDKDDKSKGPPNTTNFAELKRLKDMKSIGPDKVDNSGLIYMQTGIYWDADGQPGGAGGSGNANTTARQQPGGQQGQAADKSKSAVSFQSPPQTSWQQQPHQVNNVTDSNGDVDGGPGSGGEGSGFGSGGGSASSELQQLRLKLEQKRKEIERKKHRKEAQQNKMRQRLGKAAFMRVVSKHMDGQEPDSEGDRVPMEHDPNSTHAQLQARLGHPAGPRLPLSSSTLPSGHTASSYPPSSLSSSSSSTVPTQQLYLGSQHQQQQQRPEQRLTDWSSQAKGNRNQLTQLSQSSSSQPMVSSTSTPSMLNSRQQQQENRNGGLSQWESGKIDSVGSANNFNTLPPGQHQHQQQQQQQSQEPSAPTNTTTPSSAMTKTFSREGIQQTIDNIKNKWFRNDDSDLLLSSSSSSHHDNDGDGDAVDGDGDSSYSHPHRRTPPHHQNRPTSYPHQHQPSPPLTHSHNTTPRSKSVCIAEDLNTAGRYNTMPNHPSQYGGPNTPYYTNSTNNNATADPYSMRNATRASSAPPVDIPVHTSSRSPHQPSEQDTSFEQLSSSLTDLQEEIMHMSLQNEQLPGPGGFNRDVVGMSDALAMIRGGVSNGASTPSRPIHGIPNQTPYIRRSLTPGQGFDQPSAAYQQQQPMVIGGDNTNNTTMTGVTTPTNVPYQLHSQHQTGPQAGFAGPTQEEDATTPTDTAAADNAGFFIAFGDDAQPKRPKPKLSDKKMTTSATGDSSSSSGAPPPSNAAHHQGSSSASSASSTGSSSMPPQALDAVDRAARERSQSPHIGFVVADPSDTQDKGGDTEMQKKKIKLLEMQKKRKEDQERKRQSKEVEMARKQEEKQLKEEEAERKKADDKARRDQIFQQYMQKKNNEDDDVHPTPPIKTRTASEKRSRSKPRPKSMFVKSKPMTPEPGAYGGRDSNSSSQEDLAVRRGSPSLMSAMRSSYHFRSPGGKISMRKSVSCNTLSHNGSGGAGGNNGASTYRRPPSPDLYRVRQQRQRGNSQDSGSETGSGSNPGSDYAGPRLFVKPSAKSNRHIIVNAISHCCLAGSVNTDTKNKVLQEMSKCDANHFLILFRDASCKYRGLFVFYPETEEAFKVHGIGPKHITNDMCEKFYKYNSGGKSFTEIVSTKHLSVSVDAVVLLGSVWKTGKAAVRR